MLNAYGTIKEDEGVWEEKAVPHPLLPPTYFGAATVYCEPYAEITVSVKTNICKFKPTNPLK